MIGLSALNPYMLYIKIALVVAAGAGLFWLGWHEMGIRADLKAKTAEAALQKAQAEIITKQFNEYIQLNKEIADAIRKVKVQSNNYIEQVEASGPPQVPDGGAVLLVPAGVPSATLPGLPGFQNHTSGRVATGPA